MNRLSKILLLLLLIVLIDQTLGAIFSYACNHLKGGETKWEHYIAYQAKADIAIFGSSRANHHYSTTTLHDSLGGNVINYGKDGMGVIYSYAMMKSLTERYCPKIIILDVISWFDLQIDDNYKYIAQLRYMSDIPSFSGVINDVSPMESIKLWCQSYKYNTEWYYLCRDALKTTSFDYKINGFWPLDDKKNKKLGTGDVYFDIVPIDPVKLRYLKTFIKEASQKSMLFVFVSPYYRGVSANAFNIVADICKTENVYFYNMFCDSRLVKNDSYWFDNCHLNKYGAEKYTSIVAHMIKKDSATPSQTRIYREKINGGRVEDIKKNSIRKNSLRKSCSLND